MTPQLLYAGARDTVRLARECERSYGPPPTPKHETAHSCGNGHLGCVNGLHLRWATKAENETDKILHGTRWRKRNRQGAEQ